MTVLGKIMDAIFGSKKAEAADTTAPSTAEPSTGASDADASGTTAAPIQQVDVEAILTKMAAENKEKLDWRRSIVDLMKLLKLDSSLAARRELAKDLNYKGDTSETATMNIWLHKHVMQKLAENGGKVPESLLKH